MAIKDAYTRGSVTVIPAETDALLPNKHMRIDRARLRAIKVWGFEMSKDPNRKLGSMLVAADGRQSALGYNGLPSGIPDTPKNWARPRKYSFVIHAEENALDNAPFSAQGGSLYCAIRPCHKCLNRIMNNGIKKVIWLGGHQPFAGEDSEIWQYTADIFVNNKKGVLYEYEPQAIDNAIDSLYNYKHDGYSDDFASVQEAAIGAVTQLDHFSSIDYFNPKDIDERSVDDADDTDD